MKNRTYTFTAVIVTILLFSVWWFRPSSEKPNQPAMAAATNSVALVPNNKPTANPPPAINFISTNAPNLSSSTDLSSIYRAYQQGEINKGELIHEAMLIRNKRPQDFYGRVIDQYGQSVAGVNVTGNLFLEQGFDADEKREAYKTQTDAEGLFQFRGLHGSSLGVTVAKTGYEMGQGGGFYVPPNRDDKTSPTERAIFIMWKLKGVETMIHDKKFYGINPDGRIFTIDFVNKKKTEGENAAGDLLVRIQRPPQIQPGEKFDWSFVITAIDGGFIEVTNNGYLNEAPESGYQQTYEINMSSSGPNWQEQIGKTFYLKSRGGQVYGHFHVTVIPNYNDTSIFDVDSYINPAGSRNLEFDPLKQIR